MFCCRIVFKIVNLEKLEWVFYENCYDFVSEEEFWDWGYKNYVWNNYKYNRVKEFFKEKGKLKYMCKMREYLVVDRLLIEEWG